MGNELICSVNEKREFVWNEGSNLIDFKKLEKLTKEVNLQELLETFPKMLKGETFGRILVNPNK